MSGGRFIAVLLVTALAFSGAGYLLHGVQGDVSPDATLPAASSLAAVGAGNGARQPAPRQTPASADVAATGTTAAGKSAAPANPAAADMGTSKPVNKAVEGTAPSFDAVSLGGGAIVIAGQAEPGALVTILLGDDVLGTVEADGAGSWLFTEAQTLQPGTYALSLRARSAAVPEVPVSGQTVNVTVKDQPTAVAATAPDIGSGNVDAQAAGSPGAGSPGAGSPGAGSPGAGTDDGQAVLAGGAAKEPSAVQIAQAETQPGQEQAKPEPDPKKGIEGLLQRTEELASAASEKFSEWIAQTQPQDQSAGSAENAPGPDAPESGAQTTVAAGQGDGEPGEGAGKPAASGSADQELAAARPADKAVEMAANDARPVEVPIATGSQPGARETAANGGGGTGNQADAQAAARKDDQPLDGSAGVERIIEQAGDAMTSAGERVRDMLSSLAGGKPTQPGEASTAAEADGAPTSGEGQDPSPAGSASAGSQSVASNDTQNGGSRANPAADRSSNQASGAAASPAQNGSKDAPLLDQARQKITELLTGGKPTTSSVQQAGGKVDGTPAGKDGSATELAADTSSRPIRFGAVDYAARVKGPGQLVIEGSASPGAVLRVFLGNEEFGFARADAAGRWRFADWVELLAGSHDIRVAELSSSGETVDEVAYRFQLDARMIAEGQRLDRQGGSQQAGLQTPLTSTDMPARRPERTASKQAGKQPQGAKIALGKARPASTRASTRSAKKKARTLAAKRKSKARFASQRQLASAVRGKGQSTARKFDSDRRSSLGGSKAARRQREGYSGIRQTVYRVAGSSRYLVKRGDTLWDIARRHYGRGIYYREIYRANMSQIRNPDLIYPRQSFRLPKRIR